MIGNDDDQMVRCFLRLGESQISLSPRKLAMQNRGIATCGTHELSGATRADSAVHLNGICVGRHRKIY